MVRAEQESREQQQHPHSSGGIRLPLARSSEASPAVTPGMTPTALPPVGDEDSAEGLATTAAAGVVAATAGSTPAGA